MRALVLSVALALLTTACASTEPSPAARSSLPTPSPSATAPASPTPSASRTPPPSPTSKQTDRAGTRIQVHASDFGRILFDAGGQAIYLFDRESTRRPRCYGVCASVWPPVLTRGTPVALRGVDQSLLGTTTRRDGTTQVTYRGHPLYFYAHEGSYEVKCHDVFENGGRWYAVRADGTRAP